MLSDHTGLETVCQVVQGQERVLLHCCWEIFVFLTCFRSETDKTWWEDSFCLSVAFQISCMWLENLICLPEPLIQRNWELMFSLFCFYFLTPQLEGRHNSDKLIYSIQWKWSRLSRVWLFATPWAVAYQASQSMGFSRQEYWSGLPFPSPGDLPDPGIEPGSPAL